MSRSIAHVIVRRTFTHPPPSEHNPLQSSHKDGIVCVLHKIPFYVVPDGEMKPGITVNHKHSLWKVIFLEG